MKKALQYTLALLLCLTLAACTDTAATSKLAEENEALLTQIQQLETDLADRDATCASHETELAALRESVADLESQAATAQALAAQAEAQTDRLAALEAENTGLQNRVQELENENSQLATANATAAAPVGITGADTPGDETAAAAQTPAETDGRTVWVPRTGQKYHATSTCSNMKNPSQTTEEDAIARGFGQCSKCW